MLFRSFMLIGSFAEQWARLSNSVLPPFAQAIAEVLRGEVLGTERFTYISTFAGCGGSSLGYKWAGGRGLCAVEFDANAAATYRLNFPDTPVIERDIRKVTAQDVMEAAGLKVGELDVLDGSPPCQGFSTAGKRRMADPRNDLFAEFVRLIEGLQPRAFVMENVSGLVKGKMKLLFREMILALKATGYRVRCKLLDAKWFGVPQTRQRLIWAGARPDLERQVEYPKPEAELVPLKAVLPWMQKIATNSSFEERWETADRPAPTILRGGGSEKGGMCEASIEKYAIGDEWEKLKPGGQSEKYFQLVRAHPDKPVGTITQSGGASSIASVVHPYEKRKFTIPELRRICSFPDDFELLGSFAQQWALLGNSVPPKFMQAIAECIRDTLLQEAVVT